MQNTINQWLTQISGSLGLNPWLAPLLALLAGALTSLTPCALSGVPLVIACVGGSASRDQPKLALRYALLFAAGMSLTFTALGIAATLLGRLVLLGGQRWWYLVLGSLMLAMALQTWGVINLIPSSYAQARNTRRGYAGALAGGLLAGLFSSPCATPVLVALLAVLAGTGNLLRGGLLLLLYSAGHSLLVILAGTFIGFAGKLTRNPAYARAAVVLRLGMGALIVLIGLYFFYLGF